MKRFLKIAILTSSFLVVFAICAFYYLTSESFIKGFVLPNISTKINKKIDAGEIVFSPLSSLKLKNVVVKDKLTTLKLTELTLQYNIFSYLFDNKIEINELSLDNADIQIINIKQTKTISTTPKSAQVAKKDIKEFESPTFNISNIHLNNINVSYIEKDIKGVVISDLSIKNFNLDLSHIEINQPFKFNIKSDIVIKKFNKFHNANGSFELSANGNLSELLLMKNLDFQSKLNFNSGYADKISLEKRAFEVGGSILSEQDSYNLRSVQIVEKYESKIGSGLNITGSLKEDFSASDLKVKLVIKSSKILNIFGKLVGDYDFGNTKIGYDGSVQISNNNKDILSKGTLSVNDFSLSSTILNLKKSPPLNIDLNYDIDMKEKLVINKFSLNCTDRKKTNISLQLPEKTVIPHKDINNWNQFSDINLQGKINNLNLKSINQFIPQTKLPLADIKSLLFNIKYNINSKKIVVDLNSDLDIEKFQGFKNCNLQIKSDFTGSLDSNFKLKSANSTAQVAINKGFWNDIAIDKTFLQCVNDVTINNDILLINNFEFNEQHQNSEDIKLKVYGDFNLNNKDSNLTINGKLKNSPILSSLLKSQCGNKSNFIGNLNFESNITTKNNFSILTEQTNLIANIEDFKLENKGYIKFPLNIQIESSSSKDKTIAIKSTEIKLSNSNNLLAKLKVTGNIDPTMKLHKSQINISSNDTIYPDQLSSIWQSYKKENKSEKKTDSKNLPSKQEKTIPSSETLKSLAVNGQFKKIIYKQLEIENIITDINLKNGNFSILNFDALLNKGAIKLKGNFDYLAQNPAYNFNLTGNTIPIQPIYNSFSNFDENLVKGVISNLNLNIKSSEKSSDFLKNMNGETNMQIANFGFDKVPEKWNSIMKLLKVDDDDLEKLGNVTSTTSFKDGVAQIAHFGNDSPKIRILLQGSQVLYDEMYTNLNIYPIFSEKKAKKMKLIRKAGLFETMDNNMKKMPPIHIEGNAKNSDIWSEAMNKYAIQNTKALASGFLSNAINKEIKGNEKLKPVVNDLLNGLFGNKKDSKKTKNKTKKDEKKNKSSEEEAINGILNLFN